MNTETFFSSPVQKDRKRERKRNILYKILILSLLFAQQDDKFLFLFFPKFISLAGYFKQFSLFSSLPPHINFLPMVLFTLHFI